MAIKGKKRSKGRPRAVATAPRPFLVPPRTPPLRRRGVQVVLIVLLEGLVALLGWGLKSAQDAAENREAVERFGTQVESTLGATGVATPLPAGPLVLPDLGQALGQLTGPEARLERLMEDAGGWREQAKEAADAIQKVDAGAPSLTRARDQMVQGLRLYAVVAGDLEVAGTLDGETRERLMPNLQEELAIAAAIFDSGWGILQEEREAAGIEVNTGAPTLPGLPGVPGVPGVPAP